MKRSIFISLLLVLMLVSCGKGLRKVGDNIRNDGQDRKTAYSGLRKEVVSTYNNGQPATIRYYDKNNCWVREEKYYDNGVILMEGEIEDGLRTGEWISYFANGNVQSIGVFDKGVGNGKRQIFFENGHLWMDGYYKDDQKCGEWIFYDEQGYELERINYGPCD